MGHRNEVEYYEELIETDFFCNELMESENYFKNSISIENKLFGVAWEEYKLAQYDEAYKRFDSLYIDNQEELFYGFMRDLCGYLNSYNFFQGHEHNDYSDDYKRRKLESLDAYRKYVNRVNYVGEQIVNMSIADEEKDAKLRFLLANYIRIFAITFRGYDEKNFFETLKIFDVNILKQHKLTRNLYCKAFQMLLTSMMNNQEYYYVHGFCEFEAAFVFENIILFDPSFDDKVKTFIQTTEENERKKEAAKHEEEIKEKQQKEEAERKSKFLKFLPLIIIGGIVITVFWILILSNFF